MKNQNIIKIDNKHDEDLSGLLWTVKAIGKDYTRYALNFMKAKNNRIIATDGHRLHYYHLKNNKLEDGLYRVITAKKSEVILEQIDDDGVTYPNHKMVMNISGKPVKVKVNGYPHKIETGYCKLIRKLPDDNTINFKYYSDVSSNCAEFTAEVYGGKLPVKFYDGNGYVALVMPMII